MIEFDIGVAFVFAMACLVLVPVHSAGPVPRARVTRFARRQRLTITAGNGEQVIRYLARTRRWRTAGVVVGIGAGLALDAQFPGTGVARRLIIAGWFAGALVAEIRQPAGSTAPLHTATLSVRTRRRYIGAFAWAAVPITASLSVAGWIAAAVVVRPWSSVFTTLVPVAGALAVATVTVVVRARVVDRAQPSLPTDVQAADDAIRSRSLHVLCGAATTLILLCVTDQMSRAAAALPHGDPWHTRLDTLSHVAMVAGVLIGWQIATATFRAAPEARRPAAMAPA